MQMLEKKQLLAAVRWIIKLQTFNIFHDHAKVPPSLKGAVHGHHKWILGKGEDVSLHKGLLDLIPQNQILLIDLFHGEPLLCLLVSDQVHSPVWQIFTRYLEYSGIRGKPLHKDHLMYH